MGFGSWILVILICLGLLAISFFAGYGIAKKKKIAGQVADLSKQVGDLSQAVASKIGDAAKKV